MKGDPHKSLQASPEQVVYAGILEKGMYLGLMLILATFALYVLGIIKPYIPVTEISKYWSLSVGEYLQTANIHQGWWWVSMLGYGDFINFIGIAFLAGVTIVCFLVIVPVLWKNNDKLYAAFSLLEAVILSLAASGILGSGGH
ncbi:MAG: DUF1634 domain-containing protein [Deltaproteobacteria bacterium]|nr:DUF1634 domain-containing protein [Deltaproteobacteria bacterium]